MVSARCQVHLGMLAKANKFSRVLALRNSNKGDGTSKTRLENSTRFSLESTNAEPTTKKTMFCVSAAHSKAALLSWIKESLRTETCDHTCQSQLTHSKKCVEKNACEIVSAPWNNGKEVLKWHKFALCQTTLLVKDQHARASNWDVECKGRSV